MSLIKQKREEIIRGLDVLSVGPYLVRNGVLSQQKYAEEFGNLIEDGRAVNDEMTPKLYEVILKKPVEFCKALEESVKETQHEGHQELLTILQQNVVRDVTRYLGWFTLVCVATINAVKYFDGEFRGGPV